MCGVKVRRFVVIEIKFIPLVYENVFMTIDLPTKGI